MDRDLLEYQLKIEAPLRRKIIENMIKKAKILNNDEERTLLTDLINEEFLSVDKKVALLSFISRIIDKQKEEELKNIIYQYKLIKTTNVDDLF